MLGEIQDIKNYAFRKRPTHPFANARGFVRYHRLVMEAFLSSKYGYIVFLWPGIWDVHHINGKTGDNRIENLMLVPHHTHSSITHNGIKEREEVRLRQIGHKHSEETKAKIGKKAMGRKASEETRRKLSEMRRGRIPWNKGIETPNEVRRKISDGIRGEKNPMFGKSHTLETRRKISETKKRAKSAQISSRPV